MPKLRLIGLTLLALSATAVSHAEETRYVSDELNTWVRSGPGDNYRLVGTVNAGEEVTLLQSDANYGQIKDSSGRTAWIPLKELNTTPSLRTRVPDLENQVKTLTDKLNNIDTTWNQRTIIMQWFMYGGGVLGIGLLLGLVLPHMIPSRKRKDRWMN
ncbi:TIGR04211 family SH3 domain-containing protein [Salmonella enterica]